MILSSDHTAISSSIIMMLTVLAHNCLLTQVHSLKYAATVDPCGTGMQIAALLHYVFHFQTNPASNSSILHNIDLPCKSITISLCNCNALSST